MSEVYPGCVGRYIYPGGREGYIYPGGREGTYTPGRLPSPVCTHQGGYLALYIHT